MSQSIELPVGEHDSRQPTVLIGAHFGRALVEVHGNTYVLHRLTQNRAGDVVELRVHQRRPRMHDVDGQTAVLQSARGLQPEQAATDHHRLGAVCSLRDHADAVVERAESEHTVGQSLVVGP
jgi:hypothetical protein